MASLTELAERIERITRAPEEIRAPWIRIVRPVLTAVGWHPRVRVAATRRMLDVLRTGADDRTVRAAIDAAVEELEDDVVAVERTTVLAGRPPVAYAAWLRRLLEVLARVEEAAPAGGRRDPIAVRLALPADATVILPPLVLREGASDDPEAPAGDAVAAPAAAAAARVVELQLASIDHLLDAARAEREVLARRRRLLEAARQLLLVTAAAVDLDASGVRARRNHIAAEVARIDRLQALGVSDDVGLLHQARQAVARRDRALLYATVVALDGAARAAGDRPFALRTARALEALGGSSDPTSSAARAWSLERSAREILGDSFVEAIGSAYATGREQAQTLAANAASRDQATFARTALLYLEEGRERETVASMLAVDGCFELGGAATPVRLVEEERKLAAVRWPTQDLLLLPARDVADVPDAVVDDPRTVLLDLAAGRLLARRFVREEVRQRSRVVLQTEVRVYVLDGSGSMLGERARVRDAVLLGELATLMRRLGGLEGAGGAAGDGRKVVLYYRYFTNRVGPTTRVDSIESANAAVRGVLADVHEGGTDIEAALVASFDQIRAARAEDPELARAQIVLVTDGEAPVDEARVRAAREAAGDLPIGVSVIALGNENVALRSMVARQRARGERAFYHFVDDATLAEIVRGDLDGGVALHLRPAADGGGAGAAAATFEAVGVLVEELEALGRDRDVAAIEALDAEEQARREVGLDDGVAADGDGAVTDAAAERGDGERARREALHRDRRALERRFARWFPAPSRTIATTPAPLPPPGAPEREDVDAVLVALASVQEVLGIVGGSPLARQADAVDLVERLLPDARLTPARYARVLAAHPTVVGPVLAAVRAAAGVS